jgi:hypothetical protein
MKAQSVINLLIAGSLAGLLAVDLLRRVRRRP